MQNPRPGKKMKKQKQKKIQNILYKNKNTKPKTK